jgi:hypothetical protein
MNIITIGFDIAKGVIQVHGVDGLGVVGLRKRMSRAGALRAVLNAVGNGARARG